MIEASVGDTDYEIREEAQNALTLIGAAHCHLTPYLVAGLQDFRSEVRWTSARLLKSIGSGAEDAIPALVAAMREDDDEVVRDTAISALMAIGVKTRQGRLLLLEAMRDRPYVRAVAASVLAGSHLEAGATVSLIAFVTSGENDNLRGLAWMLLKNTHASVEVMPLLESFQGGRKLKPVAG